MTIPEQVRPAYQYWERFLHEQVDFWLKTSNKHTKEHCARVLLYCLLIADKKSLSKELRDILCTAADSHDCALCSNADASKWWPCGEYLQSV